MADKKLLYSNAVDKLKSLQTKTSFQRKEALFTQQYVPLDMIDH